MNCMKSAGEGSGHTLGVLYGRHLLSSRVSGKLAYVRQRCACMVSANKGQAYGRSSQKCLYSNFSMYTGGGYRCICRLSDLIFPLIFNHTVLLPSLRPSVASARRRTRMATRADAAAALRRIGTRSIIYSQFYQKSGSRSRHLTVEVRAYSQLRASLDSP